MRSLYTYSFLALTFAATADAQIVLDPSPARVAGHPSPTPAEQLVITNLSPNLGVNGGMYLPEGLAVDTTGSTPILYVADTLNNRILAWKNATSATLKNLQPPDLIIGQPNASTTLPGTNGGLYFPSGLVVDGKGNLYVADAGNNRVLRYPARSPTITPARILCSDSRISMPRIKPTKAALSPRKRCASPAVVRQLMRPSCPHWLWTAPAICSWRMPVTAACWSIRLRRSLPAPRIQPRLWSSARRASP